MAYLHTRKPPVLHRDLKSDNILVDDQNFCVIADFGMSRLKDKSIGLTGYKGTLSWMSPEMMNCAEGVSIAEPSDVYSFAMVIWEILTQKNLFPEGKLFIARGC